MAMATLVVASATVAASLTRLRTATARVVIAAQLAALVLLVQVPALSKLLHLRPLHGADWALVVAGGALVTVASVVLSSRLRRAHGGGARSDFVQVRSAR
jgi:Ca2+-transporting ATPase